MNIVAAGSDVGRAGPVGRAAGGAPLQAASTTDTLSFDTEEAPAPSGDPSHIPASFKFDSTFFLLGLGAPQVIR